MTCNFIFGRTTINFKKKKWTLNITARALRRDFLKHVKGLTWGLDNRRVSGSAQLIYSLRIERNRDTAHSGP